MQNVINFFNHPATFFVLAVLYLSGVLVTILTTSGRRTKLQIFHLILGIISLFIMLAFETILWRQNASSLYSLFIPLFSFGIGSMFYFARLARMIGPKR